MEMKSASPSEPWDPGPGRIRQSAGRLQDLTKKQVEISCHPESRWRTADKLHGRQAEALEKKIKRENELMDYIWPLSPHPGFFLNTLEAFIFR